MEEAVQERSKKVQKKVIIDDSSIQRVPVVYEETTGEGKTDKSADNLSNAKNYWLKLFREFGTYLSFNARKMNGDLLMTGSAWPYL